MIEAVPGQRKEYSILLRRCTLLCDIPTPVHAMRLCCSSYSLPPFFPSFPAFSSGFLCETLSSNRELLRSSRLHLPSHVRQRPGAQNEIKSHSARICMARTFPAGYVTQHARQYVGYDGRVRERTEGLAVLVESSDGILLAP